MFFQLLSSILYITKRVNHKKNLNALPLAPAKTTSFGIFRRENKSADNVSFCCTFGHMRIVHT